MKCQTRDGQSLRMGASTLGKRQEAAGMVPVPVQFSGKEELLGHLRYFCK